MQIILQEDIEKLGTRGEVVSVKEGYARNYLLPRNLALEASPGNLKRLEIAVVHADDPGASIERTAHLDGCMHFNECVESEFIFRNLAQIT